MIKVLPGIALAVLVAGCGAHKMTECQGPLFNLNLGAWQPTQLDLAQPIPNHIPDAEMTGITVEGGGIVRIHGTYPVIRLRDGDRLLCIYNPAYTAIGDNPGTGTSQHNVELHIGEKSPAIGQ